MIKVNGSDLAKLPIEFTVEIMDIDDGTTTARTADGMLHRDRIAVKRKLNLTWSAMDWNTLSKLLESVSNVFFEVTYPDPLTGGIETRTFYVGNRSTPMAFCKNNEMVWSGLSMNWIER
jgi:hypothetical protein